LKKPENENPFLLVLEGLRAKPPAGAKFSHVDDAPRHAAQLGGDLHTPVRRTTPMCASPERIGVFIDGAELFSSRRALGLRAPPSPTPP
jgi:hypothetical protein